MLAGSENCLADYLLLSLPFTLLLPQYSKKALTTHRGGYASGYLYKAGHDLVSSQVNCLEARADGIGSIGLKVLLELAAAPGWGWYRE